jgi:hypothetical protein
MGRLIALAWLLTATRAFADTPCPTVTSSASILSVNVSGNPPALIAMAYWDFETSFLTVNFAGNYSRMFIGVPRSAIQSGKIAWSTLLTYHEALMQERSVCPILYPNNLPIWTR